MRAAPASLHTQGASGEGETGTSTPGLDRSSLPGLAVMQRLPNLPGGGVKGTGQQQQWIWCKCPLARHVQGVS